MTGLPCWGRGGGCRGGADGAGELLQGADDGVAVGLGSGGQKAQRRREHVTHHEALAKREHQAHERDGERQPSRQVKGVAKIMRQPYASASQPPRTHPQHAAYSPNSAFSGVTGSVRT